MLPFLLLPPLIWLSITDIRRREISDLAVLWIVIVSLSAVILQKPDQLLPNVTTAITLTAFLWLVGELIYRRTGTEGLGIGDAKLFGAGTVWLGPWQLPEFILLSCLGGIVAALIMRGRGADQGIPFGPFIAYALFMLGFMDPIFL